MCSAQPVEAATFVCRHRVQVAVSTRRLRDADVVDRSVTLMMVGCDLAWDCRHCAMSTDSECEGVNDSLDVILHNPSEAGVALNRERTYSVSCSRCLQTTVMELK